jgi:hypothetical protein
MSQYRLREQRIYEGEWWFYCAGKNHCGPLVEYSLNKYEDYADNFLGNTPIHAYAHCPICASELVWEGYSGDSPISDGLVSLLENSHYMASTVILSAIVENSIKNLLWAALVDNGEKPKRANKIADDRMHRIEAIKKIKSLNNWEIEDITFPARNIVAHGKGFLREEQEYQNELREQAIKIRKWVEKIAKDRMPDNFNPSESGRWLLFMNHWSMWLIEYVVARYLNEDTK